MPPALASDSSASGPAGRIRIQRPGTVRNLSARLGNPKPCWRAILLPILAAGVVALACVGGARCRLSRSLAAIGHTCLLLSPTSRELGWPGEKPWAAWDCCCLALDRTLARASGNAVSLFAAAARSCGPGGAIAPWLSPHARGRLMSLLAGSGRQLQQFSRIKRLGWRS